MVGFYIMDKFDYCFNKVFVLKSLGDSDTYADDLYYETIEPQCIKCGVETEPPIEIYDEQDWGKAIDKICGDACQKPIVHIEMHGEEENGLELRLGGFIPWQRVIEDLTRINIRSENNLIVTMAVCYSTMNAYAISMVKSPAPYLFSVTTSKRVLGEDSYQLFTVFFKELIETKELYAALKKVEQDNPELAKQFDILAVPFLFENSFRAYVESYRDAEVIKRGYYRSLPDVQDHELTKEEFDQYRDAFVQRYASLANEYYRRYRDIFFMFDRYPQNRKRFPLPDTIF